MEYKAFSSLPPHAFLTLGGYTCVRSEPWSEYLDSAIQERFPWYFQNHPHRKSQDNLHKNNDCILESLKKYMFYAYGLVLPDDNLFYLYNQDGEGLLPEQVPAAISSVIEPLGYELDRILVMDQELHNGLGFPEKLVGLSGISYFDKKPGVCMINIKNGYSHAFFWNNMNKSAFLDDRFRMAVLIKARNNEPAPARSEIESLNSYCKLLQEAVSSLNSNKSLLALPAFKQLREVVATFARYVNNLANTPPEKFASDARLQLEYLLTLVQDCVADIKGERVEDECNSIRTAGELVYRVFQEL